MVTKEMLHNKLCEVLENKSTEDLWSSKVRAVVWDLLAAEGFEIPEDLSSRWERQTVEFYLRHQGNTFVAFEIKMKRAKGQSHYKYGQSWTDYSIKDFELNFFGAASVEEAIQNAKNRLTAYNEAKNNQYREMEEQVKKIQEALGFDTPQQALRICEAISRNQYYLFK